MSNKDTEVPKSLLRDKYAADTDVSFTFDMDKQSENYEIKVLDKTISKAWYITNINAVRNPDIITGGKSGMLRGNKYFGHIICSEVDEEEEIESLDSDESGMETFLRYFHTEIKHMRC